MKTYPFEPIRKMAECLATGHTSSFNWLVENGYKELVVLASLLRGKKEEVRWLMENKYVELAAFGNSVLGDKAAFEWLMKNKIVIWALTSHASTGDEKATAILRAQKLDAYLILAQTIQKMNDDGQMGDLEAAHKFQG